MVKKLVKRKLEKVKKNPLNTSKYFAQTERQVNASHLKRFGRTKVKRLKSLLIAMLVL